MEFCKVTLTFEYVDEILWCDHSNESFLPVLTHGAICFSKFHKMKFVNLVEFAFGDIWQWKGYRVHNYVWDVPMLLNRSLSKDICGRFYVF